MMQRNPEGEGQQENLENYTAEQQGRIAALAEKMEVGLENEEQVAGYLGVSVEALDQLVRDGTLPSTAETKYRRLFPRPESAPGGKAEKFQILQGDTSLQSAEAQAEDEAQIRFVLRELGLDENNPEHWRKFGELIVEKRTQGDIAEEIFTVYEAQGSSREDMVRAIRASGEHKGVIVSIDKDALERLQMEQVGSRELELRAPNGIRVEDIIGLEPKGQPEWDALKRYQDLADQREQKAPKA